MTAKEAVLIYLREHSTIDGVPLTMKQLNSDPELRQFSIGTLRKTIHYLTKENAVRRTQNLRGIILLK